MLSAILRRPLSIPLAIVGAGTASQLPQAYNQYAQYLQGRVDEAQHVAEQATQRLADINTQYDVGSTVELKALLATESGRAARVVEGDVALFEDQIGRFEWLSQALMDLGQGMPVLRFGTFVQKIQPEFLQGTLKQFQPGLPASFNLGVLAEIAAVVVIGLVLFYVVGRGIEALIGRAFGGKKRNRASAG